MRQWPAENPDTEQRDKEMRQTGKAREREGAMLVRFWGTRGSLPTPIRADVVRRKVIAALMAASGRTFDE